MEPVTALIAAAKALTELNSLAKTLGQRVPAPVREQISALYDRVSALQNAVLEKQQQAAELAERCRELEDELGRVKGWETEKARYIPQNIDQKIVYAQKPEARQHGDVPHWLCARCFEDRKKSYLQGTGVLYGGNRTWRCWRCKAQLSMPSNFVPQ